MDHQLTPLPYDYSALELTTDIQMVRLNHDMHHATYGNNLNATLEKHRELFKKSADELLRDLSSIPEDIRTTVRNNGGCCVSHTMFWKDHETQE
jgi:superoxide dismutase, Fe-Mn family